MTFIATSPGTSRPYVCFASKEFVLRLSYGKKIFLIEQEYTEAELDMFNAEKDKWVIRRAGTQYFLADSDSGEDARGYYPGYDPSLLICRVIKRTYSFFPTQRLMSTRTGTFYKGCRKKSTDPILIFKCRLKVPHGPGGESG